MIERIIIPRENDLGDGFSVRRSLPSPKKKMVGPFIFFDHMGPASVGANHGLVVRGHPHIGLATITYLFSGTIMHRDSLGNEQLIKPEEVNWMTAGRGIAHSERSECITDKEILEGLQVWIALPKEIEDIEPNFTHVEAKQIPTVMMGKNPFKLLAGKALGSTSPVPVYSQLFYLAGKMSHEDIFAMDLSSEEEGAVYVVSGKINCGHSIYQEGTLISFYRGTSINFMSESDAHVIVFGGDVFPEERFIWWNFVSSSEAKIEIAKMRWNAKGFGAIINEDEYIPLPPGPGRYEPRAPMNEAVQYP